MVETLAEKCSKILQEKWATIFSNDGNESVRISQEAEILRLTIRECLNSSTKTYHYVLPTQVISKLADNTLDCRSVQASDDRPGAFDARTVAHSVIVPFDQSNNKVLGGSPEPYVNNPLRIPSISKENRSQQKNKNDWDKLITVLDLVESKSQEKFTEQVFEIILSEIFTMLAEVIVTYPTPNRISLDDTLQIINDYIGEKSGGDRIEAVATALFTVIGESFSLYDDVKREKVNAADSSSGLVADIECWYQDKIILLVEVKDRELTLTQLNAKLDTARSRQISEILFMTQKGISPDEKDTITQAEIEERRNNIKETFGSFKC